MRSHDNNIAAIAPEVISEIKIGRRKKMVASVIIVSVVKKDKFLPETPKISYFIDMNGNT